MVCWQLALYRIVCDDVELCEKILLHIHYITLRTHNVHNYDHDVHTHDVHIYYAKAAKQDGKVVFFRIKRSTQLWKLMTAYCERQSVEFNSIAFLFDGRRLRGEQTPDEGSNS
ncbi:hypothetical protein SO802_022535 [Lithocarpus litseifolius]|uniref:Rad60/SUMO-like domain-containing protein n=1 Tax=Lithocarpus litseifolius TaxID=425828 RepID=A0AAW2C420_9ROSI